MSLKNANKDRARWNSTRAMRSRSCRKVCRFRFCRGSYKLICRKGGQNLPGRVTRFLSKNQRVLLVLCRKCNGLAGYRAQNRSQYPSRLGYVSVRRRKKKGNETGWLADHRQSFREQCFYRHRLNDTDFANNTFHYLSAPVGKISMLPLRNESYSLLLIFKINKSMLVERVSTKPLSIDWLQVIARNCKNYENSKNRWNESTFGKEKRRDERSGKTYFFFR